ncbi:MAG: hypothetical protein HZB41_09995 [Ignavibacteriae bacterium]|nr:hypothetical protein [Ignavibacteriota bacterium]
MSKDLLIFILIIITLILNSCSGDNPSGSNGSTLLPTSTGTYWVYLDYSLDSNGNRTNANPTIDSTIVTGPITLHDTSGTIFVSFSIDSNGISNGDTTYYHTNNKKVFAFSNYFTNLIGGLAIAIDLPISEQWIKLVDGEDEDWKVIEQEIPETDISGIKIKGNVTILGSKNGTEVINAESRNFNTTKFTLKLIFTGSVTIFSTTLPLNLERKTYLYFADNVGLIRSVIEPMKLDLLPNMSLPGEEMILIRHHIAN